MPLGVDHVQFSVPSVDTAVGCLTACGYRQLFREENFDSGAPFFHVPGKTMVFLSSSEVRLELINSSAEPRQDLYVPVFAQGDSPVEVTELGTLCRGRPTATLSHVEVHVADAGASAKFWRAIGFEPSADPNVLFFPRRVYGMALQIRLIESTRNQGRFVDDQGCSLIALVDQRPVATLQSVEQVGGRCWGYHDLRINGRALRSHMLRGPSGELVELIHFHPRRRDD
jgi:hypothetical protein